MTVDSFLAQHSYDQGVDPLDYAIGSVKLGIDMCSAVQAARLVNPAAFPGLSAWDGTSDSFARKTIAVLLDAGWVVPKLEDLRTKGETA